MNDRIQQVLAQMAALEDELRDALYEQETRMLFEIKGKRVEFEQSIRQAHRRLKTGFFRWLVGNRPQNLITGPVIYCMIVPLLILDLSVTLYQALCFPIYHIAKVRRTDYIVLDRHQLEYLNFFEKFHCNYCGYASGLVAYAYEMLARTSSIPVRSSTHAASSAPIPATAVSSTTARLRITRPGSRHSGSPSAA